MGEGGGSRTGKGEGLEHSHCKVVATGVQLNRPSELRRWAEKCTRQNKLYWQNRVQRGVGLYTPMRLCKSSMRLEFRSLRSSSPLRCQGLPRRNSLVDIRRGSRRRPPDLV